MKLPANRLPSLLVTILIVFLLAAYVSVRIVNLSQAAQKAKETDDTTSYVRISREPVLVKDFVGGSRPFMFPLLLKLFGSNAEATSWAQGILSIVSWSVLAAAMAYSLQTPLLKLIAFGLILLLSLYRYIIGWDSVLLTESLSLSLTALFLAGWLWLAKGWQWHKVVFVMVIGLLWAFCRDTNAWVLLIIALLLLLLAVFRLVEPKYLLISFSFIAIFFLSNLSADLGERWVFPFQNVMGRRLLANRQAVDFFAACGMPVSAELEQLAGEFASGEGRAFYEDPTLEGYRGWLRENGKRCYMQWLLSNPVESIRAPLREFNTLMRLENVSTSLFSRRFSPILPARLEGLLYFRQQPLIVFVILLLAVLIIVFAKPWKQNKTWSVAIILLLLLFPHYFIVWHGDVMGIYRHVLIASIQLYLGMWLLVLLALDTVLSYNIIREQRVSQLYARSVKE